MLSRTDRPPNRRARRRRLTRRLASTVSALAVVSATWTAPASAALHTYTLRDGPVLMSGFQTAFPAGIVPSPHRSGYIVRMNTRLVDVRGRSIPIDKVMLHHVVFLDVGHPGGPRKVSSCPGRGGEPFYGTGDEHQRLILPAGYGYKVDRRDRWRAIAMYMSHSLAARAVYLQYTVTIDDSTRLTPVRPLWLRADGCDKDSSYSVPGGGPPGSVDTRSQLWKMPFSGRIVAAGAHLHGSAKDLEITQPRCADRTLIDAKPLWGLPNDPVYRMRPVLHEPGPIATGYFLSKTGIRVRKGEYLRVSGRYDAQLPHPLVMAIAHLYLAPDHGPPAGCGRLPADAFTFWTRTDGRRSVAPGSVPLAGLGPDGRPVAIPGAGGTPTVAGDSADVDLDDLAFEPSTLSVALGATVTWHFRDATTHIVLLANGPRSVASPLLGMGATYAQTFTVPGTYNLFCYLHPLTMHETITVRG